MRIGHCCPPVNLSPHIHILSFIQHHPHHHPDQLHPKRRRMNDRCICFHFLCSHRKPRLKGRISSTLVMNLWGGLVKDKDAASTQAHAWAQLLSIRGFSSEPGNSMNARRPESFLSGFYPWGNPLQKIDALWKMTRISGRADIPSFWCVKWTLEVFLFSSFYGNEKAVYDTMARVMIGGWFWFEWNIGVVCFSLCCLEF